MRNELSPAPQLYGDVGNAAIVPPFVNDNLSATVVFDNGASGLWLDMIANSPRLKVVDYAPDGHPDGDRFAGPLSPFHSTTNSSEGEHNHGA